MSYFFLVIKFLLTILETHTNTLIVAKDLFKQPQLQASPECCESWPDIYIYTRRNAPV